MLTARIVGGEGRELQCFLRVLSCILLWYLLLGYFSPRSKNKNYCLLNVFSTSWQSFFTFCIVLEFPRFLSLGEYVRNYKLSGLYCARWDVQIWTPCREFATSEHLSQPLDGARSNLTSPEMCMFPLVH